MSMAGTIQRHENFVSKFVETRNIDVWLPPDYSEDKNFPVLYMHDGQNLFEAGSSVGDARWALDRTIARLVNANRIRSAIVVAVWNTDSRWREYMPQKVFEASAFEKYRETFIEHANGMPLSNAYLDFLVKEVKLFIDTNYHTLADQQNTFVMGSSMGGLISLYAVSRFPYVFFGAGCLSTHWPAGMEVLVDEMANTLPYHATHKLYFDYGTEGLDAQYEPFQKRMDAHLREAGYEEGKNWLTRRFEGADHNEAAWRERAAIPLEFLLGGNVS